jgi:hypothetical protein
VLSAAEVDAKRHELEALAAEKAAMVDSQQACADEHQQTMLTIFQTLTRSIDTEIAAVIDASSKLDDLVLRITARAVAASPEPAGAPAPVPVVSARLRDRVVRVDLSAVVTWGGLLEAVSTAAGVYVDSDSTLRRLPSEAESAALAAATPLTPGDITGDGGVDGAGGANENSFIASWEAYVTAGGGDFAVQQPRVSAEIVLHALLCVADGADAQQQYPPHHLARGPSHFQSQAATMRSVLQARGDYLRKIGLAASVMAKVPVQQKKLLNLAHDWLQTFLPHCLKKVNRVSFGLLNDAECRAALQIDPMLPPSRLKLSVPFVGKDVPSQSSEFAHPDIILGLSVFGYRYQVRVTFCVHACGCVARRVCVFLIVFSCGVWRPASAHPPRLPTRPFIALPSTGPAPLGLQRPDGPHHNQLRARDRPAQGPSVERALSPVGVGRGRRHPR